MRLALCLSLVAFVTSFSLRSVPVSAHPIGPPPGVTGVAGEETCVMCHNSYELNAGREERLGDLKVTGLPERYEAGKSYAVRVELTQVEDRSLWGFQISARARHSGKKYSNQPRTSAVAMNPPNITAPVRICCRG